MRPLQFKPILAASKPKDYTVEQFYARLVFPVIATPKLDGIRCVTRDVPRPPGFMCEPFTRSLKPIPNIHVAAQLAQYCPPGLDGELMTYDSDLLDPKERVRNFNDISSDIMAHKGVPNFKYHVFDSEIENGKTYMWRLRNLQEIFGSLPKFCVYVPERLIESLSQLLEYEAEQIALGYEGICFRDPNSKYKYGRSTLREGHLIKMKRFVTEEAVVIGMEEEMANNNPSVLGTTGYAERSSHSANLVGKGRMGALICKNDQGEFKVGTGFNATQRQNMWDTKDSVIGRTITFKHQPHGSKDLPRIPVFVGFRALADL